MTRRPFVPALIVAAGLLVFLGACGGGDEPEPEPTPTATSTTEPTAVVEPSPTPEPTPIPELVDIAEARDVWGARATDEYVYVYARACECTAEAGGPNRVHVRDGSVVRVDHFGQDLDPSFGWTVDELFDLAEDTVRDGKKVQMRFLPIGVPSVLRLDLEALAVDGGLALEISDFEDRGGLRERLDASRERWEAAGPSTYTLTYRWLCFCDPPLAEVDVEDGEVVDARILEGQTFMEPLTVDGLFDEIEAALDAGVAAITVSFDFTLGFPTKAQVDVATYIADEEWGFDEVKVER